MSPGELLMWLLSRHNFLSRELGDMADTGKGVRSKRNSHLSFESIQGKREKAFHPFRVAGNQGRLLQHNYTADSLRGGREEKSKVNLGTLGNCDSHQPGKRGLLFQRGSKRYTFKGYLSNTVKLLSLLFYKHK